MCILFTTLYPRWHYHFTTELNLVESHIATGDRVTVLACDASLRACDCNAGATMLTADFV